MPNYKEMYYELFNTITDIINELQEVQERTEEMYINSEETKLIILQHNSVNEEE